jgi:nucleotide-binding universal stress UspA family protein
MQIGRPVLIVPSAAKALQLEHAIVAWKDTRETRRAAFDALPLLQKAAHVSIVGIAAEQDLPATREQLNDVAGWLKRHGVSAECHSEPSTGDDAEGLGVIAQDRGADVVVAGAYGHNRVREWALGGVTRDLLLRANRCSLLSH